MDSSTAESGVEPLTAKQAFLDEVLSGMSERPRSLPCKYFYDRRGSALFDQICELDEYYLTRTEAAITNQYVSEMGEQIGEGVMLVEYGSGSSSKTRLLLAHLPNPVAYVPIDISRKHLLQTAEELRRDYPEIEILPVAADFTKDFDLPTPKTPYQHIAVYFPGSTIGNFLEHEAVTLLKSIAQRCGKGGGLLIGIDLQKDTEVLEQAYDDSEGVTAEFNLNLLHRMREELGAEIEIDQFEHVARYCNDRNRIEIYLKSLRDQTVVVEEKTFDFQEGELIHTEYSHKYSIESFARLAAKAGLTLQKSWTDDRGYFAVLHLAVLDDKTCSDSRRSS